ncbi:hypothetical protein [Brevundimonas sp.]|uniref:hypothetical protein n=1 Tax=Brevundimonas sp. TaxID=1871086 RepID=UPI001D6BF06C|nr:hypothetical protein [Brevundimonas sp.]MBL0946835.1 hypothetical protein [Brevundimonas sp.]
MIDFDHLAYLVAVIALGQAAHVANILAGISSGGVNLGLDEIKDQARRILTVGHGTTLYGRDGFVFECISWVAACQNIEADEYLRDPHIKSTTQGLDGLLIKVSGGEIARATIFEDKCSEDPRRIFRDDVMPAFKKYHNRERSSELVAGASELLKQAGLQPGSVPAAAQKIVRHDKRRYRASLPVGSAISCAATRAALFKGYDELEGINQDQRLGAVFKLPDDDVRTWIAALAAAALAHVEAQDDLEMLGHEDV